MFTSFLTSFIPSLFAFAWTADRLAGLGLGPGWQRLSR